MGTFISFIEAIAAVAAAVLAAMALQTSKQANELAEKTRDDSQKFKDEEREKDEEQRRNAVYANTWRVDKISFIDHLNEQWTYTPETGYTHQPAR